MDDCINVTCENGGTCRDSPGSFSCDCVNGYTGPECQTGKHVKQHFSPIMQQYE